MSLTKIGFYVSDKEKEMIYKDSKELGLGISAFVRFLYTFYCKNNNKNTKEKKNN